MNLFKYCFLFALVDVISSEMVSVCKSVSSSKYHENGEETNSEESFLFYEEMQNTKGDVGQKGEKGNNGTTGIKGTKGAKGEVNMTVIHELKLQLELGEFHGRNSSCFVFVYNYMFSCRSNIENNC